MVHGIFGFQQKEGVVVGGTYFLVPGDRGPQAVGRALLHRADSAYPSVDGEQRQIWRGEVFMDILKYR